jgi:hypothetical protein
MPGKRPIDLGQHSSDRTIQKGSLTGTVPPHIALRTDTLNKFANTTSLQLAQVITDETGTGNLVFNTNANLILPSFNNISTVLTGELLTGSTTANQVLLSFPKFTGANQVYGCAEVVVQSEVGDTINTIFPQSVVHRKITKFLLLFNHNTGTVLHNEYAGLSTSSSSLGTWNFIDNTTKFDLVITPANNTTTLHRAIAFCFISQDNVWLPPV